MQWLPRALMRSWLPKCMLPRLISQLHAISVQEVPVVVTEQNPEVTLTFSSRLKSTP